MISSANWTLERVRARLASSLSVMMATESSGVFGSCRSALEVLR